MLDNATALSAEATSTFGGESSCPTPHALTLYCSYVLAKFVHARGPQLTHEQAEQISKHMSECPRCIAIFNAIIDVSRESDDGTLTPRWPGIAIALGALAMAALALALMVLAQTTNDVGPYRLDKFDRTEVLNIQRPPQPASELGGRQNRSSAMQSENPAPSSHPPIKIGRTHTQIRRFASPPASFELTSGPAEKDLADTSSADHHP
jgi:hypothetical protein